MTRRLIIGALPLVAVVLLGIELRLLFYQGVIHYDDLVYVHLARRLADGVSPFAQPLPDSYGALRIGLYGPVALAYRLFGTSDVTTLAWPFLLSIAGILGAYGIGRLVQGEAAGLLAAFMIAVLPTNVAAASVLLGDGPIGALSIGVVFFLLLSGRAQGWKSPAAMVASLACFGLGILCKPVILLLLPFFVVYVFAQLRRSVLAVGAAAVVIAVAFVAYLAYFGVRRQPALQPDAGSIADRLALTATDAWSQLVLGQPEFSWLAPLCLVAIAALLAWRKSGARIVLLWLACTFLYGELGTRTLSTYTPIVWYDVNTSARHFLLVATPAAILVGIYLAQGVKDATGRWVTSVGAAVTAVTAWAAIRGATNMNWGVTGEAPDLLPFVVISAAAGILVVFGGLASPAILRAESALVRVAGTTALVIAIGLASLQPSYHAANQFKNAWVETLPEAVRFLEMQPARPIVMQSETQGARLDYLSHFTYGLRSPLRPFLQTARILTGPADVAGVPDDAYVLGDEQLLRVSIQQETVAGVGRAPAYFFTPPPRWVTIKEFGQYPGSHLRIYRVPGPGATNELAVARAALASGRSPSAWLNLLHTAIAAGAYCEATGAWFELRATAPQELTSFEPIQMLAECYKVNQSGAGPSLFQNGDFSDGLTHWATHPGSDATVQVERDGGVPAWHATYRGGNWGPIYQEQTLQPDTVYVQEAEIKTTASVVSLYWQSDVGRYLSVDHTYPEWTRLQYVFLTPHWNGQPMRVGFNPVLMNGPGEAWIKGLRLSELRAPKVPSTE